MRKLKRLLRSLILQCAALKANCSAHPQALSRGAQIVLTGRGVNSALMVGAMMHEFSWDWRDGDKLAKGDDSNIGVIARSPQIWPWLQEKLTAEKVAAYIGYLVKRPVEHYELPGIMALNCVLQRALGGGGMASLHSDPLGKCYAQMLLDMPVEVAAALLGTGTFE